MAKMFYSTEEAAQKLGVSVDQIKDYVTQNKLREFRDGAKVMFKVDQVDKLVTSTQPAAKKDDSGISLVPMGDSMASGLGLADSTLAGKTGNPSAASGTGISIFEQGEVSGADAAEKTQIQPALDEHVNLESVGSGSGLLDLTRESDDTSLGAELLDEIYPGGDQQPKPEGIGSSSGIFEQSPASVSSGLENVSTHGPVPTPFEMAEMQDPSSGTYGGLAVAAILIMLILIVALSAAFQGFMPELLKAAMTDATKVTIFAAICAVIGILCAGVGFFTGKAAGK